MKAKCCQAVLSLLLLISSTGTSEAARDFPRICLSFASATGELDDGYVADVASGTVNKIGDRFIQIENPGIIQSATAYGRGLPNLRMPDDPLPGSVPNPVPMYILMLWVEWVCRV